MICTVRTCMVEGLWVAPHAVFSARHVWRKLTLGHILQRTNRLRVCGLFFMLPVPSNITYIQMRWRSNNGTPSQSNSWNGIKSASVDKFFYRRFFFCFLLFCLLLFHSSSITTAAENGFIVATTRLLFSGGVARYEYDATEMSTDEGRGPDSRARVASGNGNQQTKYEYNNQVDNERPSTECTPKSALRTITLIRRWRNWVGVKVVFEVLR